MSDGKYFEVKTHKVLRQLNPNKEVLHNVRIRGRLSKTSRQLDVTLRNPQDYDFIAFECKDEASVIGTPTVEGYATKLTDVGARRGAIVSNSPFSKGARNMAAALQIDLLRLIDTEDSKIKTKITFPGAVIYRRLIGWSLGFPEMPPPEFPSTMNELNKKTLYLADGTSGKILDFANAEWCKIADEEDLADGERILSAKGVSIDVERGERMQLPELHFKFTYEVRRRRGILDITRTSGIYNVQTQTYQTMGLNFGPFSQDILESWEEVDRAQMEAGKFTLILETMNFAGTDEGPGDKLEFALRD